MSYLNLWLICIIFFFYNFTVTFTLYIYFFIIAENFLIFIFSSQGSSTLLVSLTRLTENLSVNVQNTLRGWSSLPTLQRL